MIFLMMFGQNTYAQLHPCGDIVLVIGQPQSQDCFVSRIPVWFEYVGNLNPAPSDFPVCNILDGQITGLLQITGILTNAITEDGIESFVFGGVNSNYNTSIIPFNNNSAFQIDISDGSNTLNFDFGSSSSPLFYFDVLAPLSEGYTLELEIPETIEYSFDSNCGVAACNDYVETSPVFTNAAISTCDPTGSQGFEFFVDLDANDIDYDPVTNEAIVTVKMKNTTYDDSGFPVERLGFSLDVSDVFGNLEVEEYIDDAFNPGHNGNANILRDGATFYVDIIPDGNTNISLQFSNYEGGLFQIKLKAPIEPFTAGEADFAFGYSRADFLGAVGCCSPPSTGGTLQVNDNGNYREPCATAPFYLKISAPVVSGCSGSSSIPVSFGPVSLPTQQLIFDLIKIELVLDFSGAMQLDAQTPLTNLHPSLSMNDITIGSNTITVFAFDQSPTNMAITSGDALFDINLSSSSSGSLENIWIKKSEYLWGGSSPYISCVSGIAKEFGDLSETEVSMGSCTGQFGRVIIANTGNGNIGLKEVDICLGESSISGSFTFDTDFFCDNYCLINGVTDAEGRFEIDHCSNQFYGISVCDEDYQNPTDRDGWMNGVSTFDLVLISKHILGIQVFDEPWKLWAADANNSRTVSTLDIIHLRKLILSLYDELPDNDSWVFLENEETIINGFEVGSDSSPKYGYDGLKDVNCNVDFLAIKIGDVNGSLDASFKNPGGEENEKMYVELIDAGVNGNGEFEIGFKPQDFSSIVGFEMTIKEDITKLDFNDWALGDLPFVKAGVFKDENGYVNVAWYDETGVGRYLNGLEQLFTLKYNPEVAGIYGVDDLSLDNDVIEAHAYRSDGKVFDIEFVTPDKPKKKVGTSLIRQIKYNDLQVYEGGGELSIQFLASSSGSGVLYFYDVQGRMLTSQRIDIRKGKNTHSTTITQSWTPGLYLVQLEEGRNSRIGKWVKQ